MADPATPNTQVQLPVKSPNLGAFGPIPRMVEGMTFTEIGSSGLRAFAGYVREEFLPQLQARQAQTVYREMSDNSPVIGGMLFAINAAMRKGSWRVNPADDTPAAAERQEFVESMLEDMSSTWEDVMAEALSMLPFGFAPMEINYKKRLGQKPGPDRTRPLINGVVPNLPKSKYDDGAIAWRSLPIRGQDTVIKWFFDENGETLGMTQQPWTGPLIDIPIQKMLLFRPSQHKNNPEGRSILRNSYRSYYMVKRMEEQEAILSERLSGFPVIRVPSSLFAAAHNGDADAVAAINQFKMIAANLRIDEQMGLVLPSDVFPGANGTMSSVQMYGFQLVSPGGGAAGPSPVSNEVIMRHNNLMMMSTLADFLTLGHGPNGTEALSDSKKSMFFQATEGYLNSNAAVLNRHGLPRIFDLNGWDQELLPEIEPEMSQDTDLDILSNYVLRLGQAGMAMFPNADLESALMDAAGLPDVADTAAYDLINAGKDMPPMPIAGPQAAAATAALMPKPEPGEEGGPNDHTGKPSEKDSPRDKFEKMIMASLARRTMHHGGVQKGARSLRKKLPKRRAVVAVQGSLF